MPAILFVAGSFAPGCAHVSPGWCAEKRLHLGMTHAEALEALSPGGAVSVLSVRERPRSGEWEDAFTDGEGALDAPRVLREIGRIEGTSGSVVAVVVHAARFWGVIGMDDFYLLFDSEGGLLGFLRHHIN